MNDMRLILLLIGLVILVGLFVLSYRQLQKRNAIHRAQDQPSPEETMSELGSRESASIAKDNLLKQFNEHKALTSQFLDNDVLAQYGDDVDWDNIDELDLEWLEESLDAVNYDELMYQLDRGHSDNSVNDYLGFGHYSPGEKVFVSYKKPDDEKVQTVVKETQNPDTLLLVIHIFAKGGKKFLGEDIVNAAKQSGMHYGEMNLFHAYAHPDLAGEVQHKQRIFSLVNIVEPGTFDMKRMRNTQTPGLSLLLQLPSPIDSAMAFEQYYETAKNLANKLDGVLYDAAKNKMTKQSLNHMKDQVAEFNLKMQFTQHASIH